MHPFGQQMVLDGLLPFPRYKWRIITPEIQFKYYLNGKNYLYDN